MSKEESGSQKYSIPFYRVTDWQPNLVPITRGQKEFDQLLTSSQASEALSLEQMLEQILELISSLSKMQTVPNGRIWYSDLVTTPESAIALDRLIKAMYDAGFTPTLNQNGPICKGDLIVLPNGRIFLVNKDLFKRDHPLS